MTQLFLHERAGASLTSYRAAHEASSILVCGCGESLRDLVGTAPPITIGVNDVGRLFDPTYLVVLNARAQFKGDRFRYVERSRARALFTQLALGPVLPPTVRFKLGRYGSTDLVSEDSLPYTQNSPYVAVCLAVYMGARRIGLLGVDFTEHHFFAQTGRHALQSRLAQIDAEYGALAAALRTRGVELVNLSAVSRLESLPRARLADFSAQSSPQRSAASPVLPVLKQKRVFVVNHRFLSCGEVFALGLRHAAQELQLAFADAYADDARLPEKLQAFAPDLVLVVHGRRFVQRWIDRFRQYNTAVWLTDEPYEVDDTAKWSVRFRHVFSNDPSTLSRHKTAHYLPVCFDPQLHRDNAAPRRYRVGFIGGYNAARERFLLMLAEAKLLDYVVGGPWRAPALRKLSLANNIPAERTAELYRATELVVNVFRETHHYNAQKVAAHSMNPRIYEALACGAAVISERRSEISKAFPELPLFDTPEQLVETARQLLSDHEALRALRQQCTARLAGHSYRDRLARVLQIACPNEAGIPASCHALPELVEQGEPVPEARKPVPSSRPNVRRPEPRARLAGAPLQLPTARSPAPRPARSCALPFVSPPRRNLLYHLWPVRGGTWQWNLDQLKRRINLFNGRRVVAIASDERSERVELVQEYLAGHGCEYVLVDNDAHGEAATFPRLMERVASTDPDQVSFYAHAKGVRYEPSFPESVRRWAETQYSVLLDDWPTVKRDLEQHALTGIFRRFGRFRNHQNVGAWHYSGTYFWLRHTHVFSRRWQDVPQFYGGVEAWPGVHFQREEAGCLLLDELRDLPYDPRFWAQRGDAAVRHWRAGLKPFPTPRDLASPAAFEGHVTPRLEQKPAEFAAWLTRLLTQRTQRLLTIGAQYGGEEWHIARTFHAHGLPIEITALVAQESRALTEACDDARRRFGANIEIVVRADATAPDARLKPSYDAAFIDGDHGYCACRADFDLARALGATLIGLHDIVDSDWHAVHRCAVSRLWAELERDHITHKLVSSDWGGIGMVTLDPSAASVPPDLETRATP